jgi:hypothetical protein
MSDFPDHWWVVRQIHQEHPHLLQRNDDAAVLEFYWRAAWALHQADPRWGMLSKSDGEAGHDVPGVGRVAHDAVAFKDAVPIVDIIAGALADKRPDGTRPPASPTWQVVQERREKNEWRRPPPFRVLVPPTDPPTDPPTTVDLAPLRAEIAALRELVETREVFGQTEARALVADILTHHLEIAVDVVPAGPEKVGILGYRFNLRHDHDVAVVVRLFGQDIQVTGRVARAQASITPDPA